MSFLTRPFAHARRIAPTVSLRNLTISRPLFEQELKRGPEMGSHTQDASKNSSAKPAADKRSTPLQTDSQSSASRDEHKSGDNHPAKQPDHQAQPTRTTGIGEGEKVEGGMEGRDEISEAGKRNLAGL